MFTYGVGQRIVYRGVKGTVIAVNGKTLDVRFPLGVGEVPAALVEEGLTAHAEVVEFDDDRCHVVILDGERAGRRYPLDNPGPQTDLGDVVTVSFEYEDGDGPTFCKLMSPEK